MSFLFSSALLRFFFFFLSPFSSPAIPGNEDLNAIPIHLLRRLLIIFEVIDWSLSLARKWIFSPIVTSIFISMEKIFSFRGKKMEEEENEAE